MKDHNGDIDNNDENGENCFNIRNRKKSAGVGQAQSEIQVEEDNVAAVSEKKKKILMLGSMVTYGLPILAIVFTIVYITIGVLYRVKLRRDITEYLDNTRYVRQ